jgi:hypothetical protein
MMTRKINGMLCLLSAFLLITMSIGMGRAQSGSQGTISVTVVDSSGGVVPGTTLQLVDMSTNDIRNAVTRENGQYTFVNLSIGTYRLTASHAGYQSAAAEGVEVHAAVTKDVAMVMKVGTSTETVVVNSSAAPLLETNSNSVGSVVDLKMIEELPMTGRDLTAFSRMTAGYSGDKGSGSWNGQPLISQGSNIDGTIGASSRMKIFGDAAPAVVPRLENVEEMTVQTDQLDLDQGFGQATMQINFVSRRGTNQLHGRAFENFHNSGLNANSYANNTLHRRRPKNIYNDFGGSVGGQILKDKLFYFGSFSMHYVPGAASVTNNSLLSTAAQQGNFTYTYTDPATQQTKQNTVNVLTLAQSFSSTLPGSIHPTIASQISAINGYAKQGTLSSGSNPNLASVTWDNSNPIKTFFPSFRLDYNATQALRMSLAWSMTEDVEPGVNRAPFPGGAQGGNKTKNYTSSYGVDWTVSPSLINQFKLGFLYNATFNNYNASSDYKKAGFQMVDWAIGDSGQGSGDFQLPITSYYPAFNATDTVTLQKSTHTTKFGFTGYHEQDHYWNAPSGWPDIALGIVNGDPAQNAFNSTNMPNASSNNLSNARALYATLVGRVASVSGQYTYNSKSNDYARKVGSYALDEVTMAWGLFAQDSWRIKPTLTLNYGLRWDFTGASTDKSGLYHSADTSSTFGPTAPTDLFKPGVLNGNPNPTLAVHKQSFDPYHVTPQPAFGLAWNPKGGDGWMGKLTGNGSMVVRTGYSLRRFTEPYQYYWNNASDQGAYYYQGFAYNGVVSGVQGTFTPGSLKLGDAAVTTPGNYAYAPASYQASEPQSDFTFLACGPACNQYPGVTGIDQHIKQPYTQSWNFGIQRSFGSRVLEVSYAGNRTLHQWVNQNTNEVNVFENGFLDEFKKAQANLAAFKTANPHCGESGNPACSFANNGLSGQSNLPILNAAFAGEASGGPGVPLADYANGDFINDLNIGQVGALAQMMTGIGTTNYFCNLVGSSFAPCRTNGGYTGGVGAAKPINFFQANPYATNSQTQYMEASGYSNYHSLQVEMRQQLWHGLQYNLNYTWAHTLGYQVNTNGSSAGGYGCAYYGYAGWCGWPGTLTLRNRRLAYGPAQYDIRHAVHLSGTYDLPIGKGKLLLSQNNLASRILGDWNVGYIVTFQTGTPQQIIGNNLTYNDYGDGGVKLNNVTMSQLQSAIGVHRIPGKTYALLIDPKYVQAADGTGGANNKYITPNTTPGTIEHPIYLHGPHGFYNDLSLSKNFPIFREFKMRIQAEATNVWNHPVFGNTSGSFAQSGFARGDVTATGWATSGTTVGARVIELRANIEF